MSEIVDEYIWTMGVLVLPNQASSQATKIELLKKIVSFWNLWEICVMVDEYKETMDVLILPNRATRVKTTL